MEKDVHYYLIYSLARAAGLKDPDLVAYASQFVDDNNEGQFLIDGESTFFPKQIPAGGGHYYPIMTQSLSPKSLDIYVQKYVYLPFHFLPGDNSVVIKNQKNPMSTTPNSPNAVSALDAAFETGDPYRIGIALHTYADTWSHQNFTGFQEAWNSVYPWYNVFKSIAPNIGHAEAGHLPDMISDVWTDHRLDERIDNRVRALAATAEIYKAMRKRTRRGPTWTQISGDCRKIIYASGYDDRIAAAAAWLAARELGKIPSYSKDEWINAALDRSKGDITMKPGFEKTHWYHFHQAAKCHFATVMALIKHI